MECLFLRADGSNENIYYMIFVDFDNKDIHIVRDNKRCPENIEFVKVIFDGDFSAEKALEATKRSHEWKEE